VINVNSLIAPAIVAALISGLVTGLGIWISARTSRKIHAERLAYDREQTERKVSADIDLADKKLTLDQALAAWKRRSELAEQALVNFYEARRAFVRVRSVGIFEGEGESRPPEENEDDALKRRRNTLFIPIERLSRENQVFMALQALRPAFEAHFGPSATKPFQEVLEVYAEIQSAAGVLVQVTTTPPNEGGGLVALRDKLGWGPRPRPDEIDKKIDEAVHEIEVICQPVLTGRPTT
jgi:hypothetical protein